MRGKRLEVRFSSALATYEQNCIHVNIIVIWNQSFRSLLAPGNSLILNQFLLDLGQWL